MSYPDDAPGVSRREALLRLASAATVAAAMGAGAFYFHDRRLRSGDTAVIPDWRMPGLPELPAAVAARGANPAANVRRALAALGGMERFVHRGEKVVIKPNVGWDRIPEQAANTDPTLVAGEGRGDRQLLQRPAALLRSLGDTRGRERGRRLGRRRQPRPLQAGGSLRLLDRPGGARRRAPG